MEAVRAMIRDNPIRQWQRWHRLNRREADDSARSGRWVGCARMWTFTWSGTSGSTKFSISLLQCLLTYFSHRTPANCRILISRVLSTLISVKASVYLSSNSNACNWVWPFSINLLIRCDDHRSTFVRSSNVNLQAIPCLFVLLRLTIRSDITKIDSFIHPYINPRRYISTNEMCRQLIK